MPIDVFVPPRISGGTLANPYFADWQPAVAGDDGKVCAWNNAQLKYVPTAFATAGDLSTHVAATAAHGATGAVVGTTNTQTLTNKTLTTPTIASFINAQHAHTDAASGGVVSGGGGTPGGSVGQVQVHGAGGVFAGDSGFTYDVSTDVATLAGRLIAPKWSPAADSTTALQMTKADGVMAVVTVDTTNGRVGLNTTPSAARLRIKGNGYRDYITFEDHATINNYGHLYIGDGTNGTVNGDLYFDGVNSTFHFRGGATGVTERVAFGEFVQVAAAYRKGIGFRPSGGAVYYLHQYIGDGTNGTVSDEVYFDITNTKINFRVGAAGTTDFLTISNNSRVGIGHTSPNNMLDVAGTVQADSLRLDIAPTAETPTMTHTITVNLNGTNYKIPCVAA